jgi:hypothetical protein
VWDSSNAPPTNNVTSDTVCFFIRSQMSTVMYEVTGHVPLNHNISGITFRTSVPTSQKTQSVCITNTKKCIMQSMETVGDSHTAEQLSLAVKLFTCIQDMLGSNLCWNIGYRRFPRALRVNIGIVSRLRHGRFISIRHSSFMLSCGAAEFSS